MASEGGERLRVDKWLWQARFFKTRALSAEVATSGRLRINSARCEKPAQTVRPGDVLTFPQAGRVRVIRVEAIGTRRGPAAEAATLYADLDPPAASPAEPAPGDPDPGGRPSPRERRQLAALRGGKP